MFRMAWLWTNRGPLFWTVSGMVVAVALFAAGDALGDWFGRGEQRKLTESAQQELKAKKFEYEEKVNSLNVTVATLTNDLASQVEVTKRLEVEITNRPIVFKQGEKVTVEKEVRVEVPVPGEDRVVERIVRVPVTVDCPPPRLTVDGKCVLEEIVTPEGDRAVGGTVMVSATNEATGEVVSTKELPSENTINLSTKADEPVRRLKWQAVVALGATTDEDLRGGLDVFRKQSRWGLRVGYDYSLDDRDFHCPFSTVTCAGLRPSDDDEVAVSAVYRIGRK